MERRGRLNVPVIGVARTKWTLKQFRARVADSVAKHGTPADRKALPTLLERLRYVAGEYHKPATYAALAASSADVERPTHYLAIPPSVFPVVVRRARPAPAARRTRAWSSRSRSGATSRRRWR